MTLKQLKIKLYDEFRRRLAIFRDLGIFLLLLFIKSLQQILGLVPLTVFEGIDGKHQPQGGGQCTGECAEGGVFTLG